MDAKAAPKSILTPYLSLKDTSAAIAFYTKAFGATECYRLTEPLRQNRPRRDNAWRCASNAFG
jgi:uncharacterized glyoxalase superfamily protein PhnB